LTTQGNGTVHCPKKTRKRGNTRGDSFGAVLVGSHHLRKVKVGGAFTLTGVGGRLLKIFVNRGGEDERPPGVNK